jgi:hypothetical protein
MRPAALRTLVFVSLVLAAGCKHDGETSDQKDESNSTIVSKRGPSDMASPFDPKRSPNRMAPDEAQFAAGEWGSTADYRMRFLTVKECEVESYFAPQEGHIKLGIEVELEGLSSGEVPANQLHAALVDGEGARFAPTLAGCRPALPAGRVTKGKATRGFVTFEVPKAASGLVLRYEPFILGRADGALSFTLGR